MVVKMKKGDMFVIAYLPKLTSKRNKCFEEIYDKYISSFLFKNNWKKEYWFVLCGCVLTMAGIYSIGAYIDFAPCTVLAGRYKIIACSIFCIVVRGTIPPNTYLAKFATNNFARYN